MNLVVHRQGDDRLDLVPECRQRGILRRRELSVVPQLLRDRCPILGDDFDHAFASKSEWNAARGEKGGRYRDINEPFQPDYLEAARAAIAAMPPQAPGWRPIAEAPRDGTRILARYKSLDGYAAHLDGRTFEVWHEGVTPSDYDLGWALFPGYGGVPDKCLPFWLPLLAPPLESDDAG